MKLTRNIYRRQMPLVIMAVLAVVCSSCGRSVIKTASEAAVTVRNNVTVKTNDSPQRMIYWVYAYGRNSALYNPKSAKPTNAITYITDGNIKGLMPEDARGPWFAEMTSQGTGETQPGQFIAIMLDSGLEDLMLFTLDSGKQVEVNFFLKRLVNSVATQKDGTVTVNGNRDVELGWLLLALARIDNTDSRWTGNTGRPTGTDDIVETVLRRPAGSGEHNGLVAMRGVAAAARAHRTQIFVRQSWAFRKKVTVDGKRIAKPDYDTVPISGVWLKAEDRIAKTVRLMKKNQGDDGAFDASWYRGKSAGNGSFTYEKMLYTALVFDFLGEALEDEELEAPWVKKTVTYLARSIEANRRNLGKQIEAPAIAVRAMEKYRIRLVRKGKAPVEADIESCCR